MRARNFISFAFIMGFGVFMAILGYMGRTNFVDGQSMIFMTLFTSMIAGGVFWAIWNLELHRRKNLMPAQSLEKRKRAQLDSVLRDLSDEDLYFLRRRLASGDFDEVYIDEEGELIAEGYRR